MARVGSALVCAAAVVGLIAAGPAAAKGPRARSSVIGGTVANLQQWGFTVAVLTPTTLCTGEVISSTRVVTAAHCVGSLSTMIVRANSTSAFTGGDVIGVASAAIAPGWAHGFESDLAVLTLKTPTTAPPIQLASAADDAAYTHAGAPLSIAGFGNRNPLLVGKQRVGLLTVADVSVKFCGLPSWAICDSGRRVGRAFRRLKGKVRRRAVIRAVCSGDSGGPLVANTSLGPRLVGVAEASSGPVSKRNPFFFVICGLKGYPSLHTRVLSYLGFLQANLGP